MIRIVLDNEQAKAVAQSRDSVEVYDQSGNVLGVITAPVSADELAQIAEIKRRLSRPQPRYTVAQVREHLDKLAEK